MPIRINLLAESQALEDQRRRDPVKRAIAVGALLVAACVVYSIWLQGRILVIKRELANVESQITARSKEFQKVLDSQRELNDVTHRLGSLGEMATNRLLYGTLLNAMQQTTIDEVQLTRFRAEQSYFFTEGTKAKTNEDHVIPGKPATVTEKILLALEAKDTGANPGDQVNRFKQAMAASPYFRNVLGKTNEFRLTSLSPPQALDGKPFVQFSLECRFPERTR